VEFLSLGDGAIHLAGCASIERQRIHGDVCFPAFCHLLHHRLGAVSEQTLGHRYILGDRFSGLGIFFRARRLTQNQIGRGRSIQGRNLTQFGGRMNSALAPTGLSVSENKAGRK
jgi:hypothetical protein